MYPETVSVNHEAYCTYTRRIETYIHDFLRTYHSSRACSVPGSQVLIEGCSTVKDPSLSVTNQIRCESQRRLEKGETLQVSISSKYANDVAWYTSEIESRYKRQWNTIHTYHVSPTNGVPGRYVSIEYRVKNEHLMLKGVKNEVKFQIVRTVLPHRKNATYISSDIS